MQERGDHRHVVRHADGFVIHARCGEHLMLSAFRDTPDQRELCFYCRTCLEHIYLSTLATGDDSTAPAIRTQR